MHDTTKIMLALIVVWAAISITIFATADCHAYCADSRECLVTKPRSDGALDPETIYQNGLDVYNSSGQYRGRISNNPYDPLSLSDSYGRYGNQYSSESLSNPFGPGNSFFGNTTLQDDED